MSLLPLPSVPKSELLARFLDWHSVEQAPQSPPSQNNVHRTTCTVGITPEWLGRIGHHDPKRQDASPAPLPKVKLNDS